MGTEAVRFLVLWMAGWINSRQLEVIAFLREENRVLREQIGGRRLRFTDGQRRRLAVKGRTVDRRRLGEFAGLVTPDTILRWYRELIARKYDGSARRRAGCPTVAIDVEQLVVRMATENPTWGYTRLVGALDNLGHQVGRNTVKRVLRRHGLEPAPARGKRMPWKTFLRTHLGAIAVADFFSVEVLTLRGLVRYLVLFVIDLQTRRVQIGGVVRQPYGAWMTQVARNLTDGVDGFLIGKRYLLHDRDPLFTDEFRGVLAAAGVKCLRLPARSPNLNSIAERFVLSIKSECLSKLVPLGENHLRRAVSEYVEHYHRERNHQGVGNRLLTPAEPAVRPANGNAPVERRERLGGLLNFYCRPRAGYLTYPGGNMVGVGGRERLHRLASSCSKWGMRLPSVTRIRTWVLGRVEQLWSRLAPHRSASEIAGVAVDAVRSRRELIIENAVLRHQVNVLRRRSRRSKLNLVDRLKLLIGARLLPSWRRAIAIVQPETVLRWHRAGFRLFWRRRSLPRKTSPLPPETIDLIRDMAARGRLWGAERIRGELLKLGIKVSKRTIQKYMRSVRGRNGGSGQRWATFLKNHAERMWVCDFIQTHDLLFRQVYAFFLVHLASRRVVHIAATRHPRQAWTAQQLRNATMDGEDPAVLLRDRDDKFGPAFDRAARGVGAKVIRTAVRAPNMNAVSERFVGSVRRELLDHVLVLDEGHLGYLLRQYQLYFNESRPHQGIGKHVPTKPVLDIDLSKSIEVTSVLGGLHVDYRRAA